MADTIRFSVGMDVNQFNAQPAVARQPVKLSPTEAGVIVIGEPHELELELNGRTVKFVGGGENAFTYIKNGFFRPDAESLTNKVESVVFNLNRELVTLAEAIDIASKSCKVMREAGLGPRDPSKYGIVNESVGRLPAKILTNETDLRDAFVSAKDPAVNAVFCELEDDNYIFALQMRNSRRTIQSSGKADEDDVVGERQYRLQATFAQNIERLAAKSDALRMADRGSK